MRSRRPPAVLRTVRISAPRTTARRRRCQPTVRAQDRPALRNIRRCPGPARSRWRATAGGRRQFPPSQNRCAAADGHDELADRGTEHLEPLDVGKIEATRSSPAAYPPDTFRARRMLVTEAVGT
jgi:hypothetical protein